MLELVFEQVFIEEKSEQMGKSRLNGLFGVLLIAALGQRPRGKIDKKMIIC